MRHATWQVIERSRFLHRLFSVYRNFPAPLRAPLRVAASPLWYLVSRMVLGASQQRVVAGPFRGMRLELSPLSKRHLVGYLIGSQELELREIVERIVARKYEKIVNVGAADGYYAVGLARRMPGTEVVAFEALPNLHPVISKSASENGVAAQIRVEGPCDKNELGPELGSAKGHTLVFMDIEGGEMDLLDPQALPALRETDIFVETHDSYVPGGTRTLIERFGQTHTVERLQARPRVLSDFPKGFMPALPRLFPRLIVDLMDERRTGQQEWLFLTSRSQRSNATP